MKRYRSSGGFCRLMSISCVLTVVRLALLALFAWLFLACKAYPAAAAALVLSLGAEWLVFWLIHRCGLATKRACSFEIIANALTKLAVLTCMAARWAWLRIPAGILFLLSLPGLAGKLRRVKQTAV